MRTMGYISPEKDTDTQKSAEGTSGVQKSVNQIVVPLPISMDAADIAEGLGNSLEALRNLIDSIDSSSEYVSGFDPAYAVREYVVYLEATAKTLQEIL